LHESAGDAMIGIVDAGIDSGIRLKLFVQ